MPIIEAFINFIIGLIYLFVDLIRHILNFILNLLNMIF